VTVAECMVRSREGIRGDTLVACAYCGHCWWGILRMQCKRGGLSDHVAQLQRKEI
jgi:hypothetical protein